MSADSAAAQPATPDSLIEQCLAGDQLAWEQIVRQVEGVGCESEGETAHGRKSRAEWLRNG